MIQKVSTEMNYYLSAELMKELSNKEDTSELMAVIEMREDRLDNVPLSDNPFIVLFDRPSNKGNLLGTTAYRESPLYNANLSIPLMLMMGNETIGLNKTFKEHCDVLKEVFWEANVYEKTSNSMCGLWNREIHIKRRIDKQEAFGELCLHRYR